MATEQFLNLFKDLTEGMEQKSLLNTRCRLILLYSSIDILASLTRPIGADKTNGGIFKNWVKDFMIGTNSYKWNEEDIWGARCGILHTSTVESDRSRGGNARKIQYIVEDHSSILEESQALIDPGMTDTIVISLSELISAFALGMQNFAQKVHSDAVYQQHIFTHTAKLADSGQIYYSGSI